MSCRGSAATSTFSMSMGLATQLGERGIGPHEVPSAPGACPKRFSNIVTEVERGSGDKSSGTDIIYTNSSLYMPPIEGLGASCGPMKFQPENSYLNLVEKVKDIGLNSILNIVSSSGLKPVQLDPIDVGLNTIMGIKRNRGLANQVAGQKALTNQTSGLKPRVSTSHRKGGAQTFTTSTNLGPVTSVTTYPTHNTLPGKRNPPLSLPGQPSTSDALPGKQNPSLSLPGQPSTSHVLPGKPSSHTIPKTPRDVIMGDRVIGGAGQPYIPPNIPSANHKPARPTSLHLTNTNNSPMMSTQAGAHNKRLSNVNNPHGDGPNNNVTMATGNTGTGGVASALLGKLGLGGVAAGLTSSKAKS